MTRTERLMIYAALALTLLLPGAPLGCDRLRAQTPPGPVTPPLLKLPTTVNGPPGFLVVLAETNCASLSWYVIDPGVQMPPPDWIPHGSKSMLFMGMKPGSYRVLAYGALGDQVTAPAVCTVVIDGPPTPPPPPPPPPPPNDPLTAVLQAAYDADTGPTKAAALATLADIHAGAADLAGQPTITTFGQLAGAVHTVAVGKLGDKPGGQLLGVRSAIGAEEAKVFAGTTTTPLSAANRADLQKWYARVSACLKGVKP